MLFYNIFRFEIDDWKDLEPEALDRMEMVTKRYWLSFGDQNLLNELFEEMERVFDNAALFWASEEETEAILKEMEEQRKQKDSKSITDSLLKKKAKIQEILSTKIFDDKKEKTTNILIENNLELNNGEVVVVQMEEDEPMLNVDFDKMHANEIFGILGWQQSKIVVVKKKKWQIIEILI